MSLDERDPIDVLIDDVAGAMTSATPDDRFAGRVSQRIADTRGGRSTWLRPWVLVAIATASVIAVAVVAWRNAPVRPTPDTAAAATTHVRAPGVASADSRERGFPPRGRPRARRPEGALQNPAPMTIAPIDVDSIDVQPLVEMNVIQIAPIAIDRIDIAAMP